MSGINCSIAGATYAAAARTAKTVTAVGNAQVDTAQSKFGGASALFDGTSDYLTVSAGGFNVGTGDITIEFFVRHNAINDQQVYCDFRTGTNNHFIFYVRSDNKLELFDGGSTYTSVVTMAANTWYHLAISRSGTSLKVYRDGTEVMSATNTRNLSDNSSIAIGSSYEGFSTNSVNGWMDEIRVSNTARYTAGFTPTTTAFTNDANTLLLIHADGTDASTTFTDDVGVRSPAGISAIGNAQISTAQSKFGGSSILLDGTDDYLVVGQNNNFNFGTTGNFTIEFWIYFTTWTAPREVAVWEGRTGAGNGAELIFLYTATTLGWYVYKNSGTRTSTGVASGGTNFMTANTWQHVALVRNGTNLQIYIDGTARGTPSTTDNLNYSHASYILIGVDEAFNRDGNGYIDEYRVSNIARYTGNFTPSGSAFVNDSNTVLLIHADGTNGLTRFTDDNA